jgi:hypothetical protein
MEPMSFDLPERKWKACEAENHLKRHTKATLKALGMAIENEFSGRELGIVGRLRQPKGEKAA